MAGIQVISLMILVVLIMCSVLICLWYSSIVYMATSKLTPSKGLKGQSTDVSKSLVQDEDEIPAAFSLVLAAFNLVNLAWTFYRIYITQRHEKINPTWVFSCSSSMALLNLALSTALLYCVSGTAFVAVTKDALLDEIDGVLHAMLVMVYLCTLLQIFIQGLDSKWFLDHRKNKPVQVELKQVKVTPAPAPEAEVQTQSVMETPLRSSWRQNSVGYEISVEEITTAKKKLKRISTDTLDSTSGASRLPAMLPIASTKCQGDHHSIRDSIKEELAGKMKELLKDTPDENDEDVEDNEKDVGQNDEAVESPKLSDETCQEGGNFVNHTPGMGSLEIPLAIKDLSDKSEPLDEVFSEDCDLTNPQSTDATKIRDPVPEALAFLRPKILSVDSIHTPTVTPPRIPDVSPITPVVHVFPSVDSDTDRQ